MLDRPMSPPIRAGRPSRVGAICEQHHRLPCWFFANALIRTHLNGRLLPPSIERAVMDIAQARFNDCKVPVLTPELRECLDQHAFARDPRCGASVAPNEKSLAAFERLAALSRRSLFVTATTAPSL